MTKSISLSRIFIMLMLPMLVGTTSVLGFNIDRNSVGNDYFVESPYSTASNPIYFYKTSNGFVVFEKGKVTYQNIKVTKKSKDPLLKDVFIPEQISVSNTVVLFDGSNLECQIVDNSKSLFPINYFLSDVQEGNSNRHALSSIIMKEVYRGIDIKYYFQDGNLKYDIIAKAHSDLNKIKIRILGDELFTVKDSKKIQLNNFNSPIEDRISYSYQEINNEVENVEVNFKVKDGVIGFVADNLNNNYDLIIDPALIFSTFVGGSSDDYEYTGGISKDNSGSIVVTGRTLSTNFPTTAGSYQTSNLGNIDCVVFKLDSTGQSLLFATYLGGNNLDAGYTSLVNPVTNDIVIGGTTASTIFPVVSGAYQVLYGGGAYDGFVARLDNAGSVLINSTFMGNNQQDLIASICFDTNYDVIFVGQSTGSFIQAGNGYQSFYGGGPWDVFVGKINQNLTSLTATTMLGGNGDDHCHAVKVDATGNVCIMGFTSGSFPVSPGSFDVSYNGGVWDTYCAKFNSSLSQKIFSTYVGSSGDDWSWNAMDVDDLGNMYVTGYTSGNDFPTTSGCFQNSIGGNYDVFVYKLNSSGNTLLQSTYIGSNGDDEGWGIVATNYRPVITGCFQNGLTTQVCSYAQSNNGLKDAFYLKLDSTFSNVISSSYFGGQNDDIGNNILQDGSGFIIAGATKSTNFPTSFNAYDKTQNGGNDFFVLKFQVDSAAPVAQFIADTVVCVGSAILFQNNSVNGQSYLWDFGDNSTSSISQPVHSYNSPGNFTVTLTVDNCISTDVAILNIKVVAIPVASFSYQIDCNKEVTVVADSSAQNYLWNLGPFGSSTADSVVFSLINTDSIVVTLISFNGNSCSDTISQTIVSTLPSAGFTAAVTPCTHDVFVQPLQTVSNAIYNWTIAGLQSQNSGQPFYITIDSLLGYQIELIVNAAGCSDTISQSIQFDSLPVAQFATSSVCSNPVQFINNSLNNQNAMWYFGNGDSSNAINPLYNYNSDGPYVVSLVVQNANGCKDSISNNINVHTSPQYQVLSVLDSCSGVYNFDVTPSIQNLNAIWNFGDGTILQNPGFSHSFANPGNYSISIITNPGNSCPDTIRTILAVNEYTQPIQFLPNCFTPNDDSVNDFFLLNGPGFCNYLGYSIYNRWGQLLFSTTNTFESWDGKSNGVELPEGVYIVTLKGEKPLSYFITIMR